MIAVRIVASLFFLSLAIPPIASGQTVSGSIVGVLNDATGAVIAGATVQLGSDLTKQVREFTTDSSGGFAFPNLMPGSYNLRIAQPGFKEYVQTGINVGAQARVDVHTIRLELGNVNTSVEVQANAVQVGTDSSDRAVDVGLTQIQDTPVRGRHVMALAKSLPGVQDLGNYDSPGWGNAPPTVMGGQGGQFLVTYDGVAAVDSGAPARAGGYLGPSMEAISEVKVLVSNYPAEYGARNGGQMNVVFKNGTANFHGSGFLYMRNEALNANEFFNNSTGTPKPPYRYANYGGSIGGPVLIPGTSFNKSRTKLFFFASLDYLRNVGITSTQRFTMPTVLERSGDFSQTVTSTGTLIPIKDPASGAPFPGNIIPTSRLSPQGFALLNLFPLPNTTDPTGKRQYNFSNALSNANYLSQPRHDRIVRVDYTPGPKTTAYVRIISDYWGSTGYGPPGWTTSCSLGWGWGQYPCLYDIPGLGVVGSMIHLFAPNLVNEFTFGTNRSNQRTKPVSITGTTPYESSLLPSLKGPDGKQVTIPSLFGANNLNLIPGIRFDFPSGTSAQSAGNTIPGPSGNNPIFGYEARWPYNATDYLYQGTESLSWIKGGHRMKFGVYLEYVQRNVPVYATWGTNGRYYFGSDTSSPSDTGYPFSNALFGSAFAYGEDNKEVMNYARYTQLEWYAQDSWKIHRRLTIDYGMRFSFLGSVTSNGADLGFFSSGAYNSSKAGQLLYPAVVNGKNVSINPVTGATYAYSQQGTFDPASYTTSPYSGIVDYKTRYWNDNFRLGPRLGFALDVFGNGKTALRGGVGIFYGRAFGVDTIGATGNTTIGGTGPMHVPPAFKSPLLFSPTISGLASSQITYAPAIVYASPQSYQPPSTYSWSFGIQQDLGHGLIFDLAYVGNVSHNTWGTAVDLNAPAPYTTWTPTGGPNPKYLDPTSGGKRFYSTDLVRALAGYAGFGAINLYTQAGESNYNSLQIQMNKRFGKRLQFNTNYTWSKALVYNRNQFLPDDLIKDVASTNRPHAFNANFGYSLPDGSRLLGKPTMIAKQLLDGWRIFGESTLFAGLPMTVTCSAISAPIGYWYGTPAGTLPNPRCQMGGSLWLPSGTAPPAGVDPKLWYPFNAASFSLPAATSFGIGSTPPTLLFGPGAVNVDLSVSKDFRLTERWNLQLMGQAYNFLNHFSPANPDGSLQINYLTGANSNAAFGQTTAAQGAQVQARHVVLSLRVTF